MRSPSLQSAAFVLRFGRPSESSPDHVSALLASAHLSQVFLPDVPPSSPRSFRNLTRRAAFVLLDLDLGQPAVAWQQAFRQHRPYLPLIGCFSEADLSELLPAGIYGLHGAFHLPGQPEALAALLSPWLPAPPPGVARSDSLANTSTPFPVRARRLPAAHLSPASDSNQNLLQSLDDHPDATRFIAHGPPGSEFTLLALELAARAKVSEANIHFSSLNSANLSASSSAAASTPRLLVTRDRAEFDHTRAAYALLICDATEEPSPASSSDSPPTLLLRLNPLHRRLPDLACYVQRHLPALASAARHEESLLPLPATWRHALLAHSWPGQFAELWRVLQQLALTPRSAPVSAAGHSSLSIGAYSAPNWVTPPDQDLSFEHLLSIAAPRAYRARLKHRVPTGLLHAVVAALGCPDLPPGHE